jgi:putative membrane protein insertion efficiency factor
MLIAVIRVYQRCVSPLLPPVCRFYPSCSEYAVQAIVYYGPLRGVMKAVWRLLRCHPLSRGGVDLPIATRGDSS